MKTTFKKISENEVEIACEIPSDVFEKERPEALKRAGNHISLPGFRKGHIPEAVLIQKFGEGIILEEMLNLAVEKAFPEIMKEHKFASIGMPSVNIKKLAKGNPFEFTLTFPTMPEIKLPDYKKIAKEIMKVADVVTVTDEEFATAELGIRKQLATKDAEGKEIIPELTLEVAQKFGAFKTIEEFKTKLRESLVAEKENQAKSKKRMQTMEKIADGINVKLPQVLIDGELERMMGQFRYDIERMGMKLADYLTAIKKTEESMRKEWLPDAEKRAKVQIALTKIATEEKLEVPKEELEKEVKHFLEHYKDIPKERAERHLEIMIMNEKVFKFLEGQK
ncbi:MAG: trigger factor [Candidatus Pacebacteria bacterium]|nr:trigger factor [Candidatus Paceibacterota bacterium]